MTTADIIRSAHGAYCLAKQERAAAEKKIGGSYWINRKGVIGVRFADGSTVSVADEVLNRVPLPLTLPALLAAMGQASASTSNPQS